MTLKGSQKVGIEVPAHYRRFVVNLCFIALTTFLSIQSPLAENNRGENNDEIQLPDLGDGSSAVVSHRQERELGKSWLRVYRSRVPSVSDPILFDYLEHLIYRLATHSQLKERQFNIVIVDNPAMNAFAVPGGIVGIHNGLFMSADNEDQLSAVLSHELAHLSQRHFARGIEEAKRQALPNMAALLGSLVIAATTGGDAGIAALTAAQARAIQSQLSFSRHNEREADHVGMTTMVKAGMNPLAIADMFEQMQRTLRFAGGRPPEFLLTHPVTESRIADARNRASKYSKRDDKDSFDFHLVKTRVILSFAKNPLAAAQQFRDKASQGGKYVDAHRYGLAQALIQAHKLEEAGLILEDLLKKNPNQILYVIAKGQLLSSGEKYQQALDLLEKHLALNPDNHPLTMSYADILLQAGEPFTAERVLQAHVVHQPENPDLWYILAETHGLAKNIIGVHQARAEYFILNGILDQAQRQLEYGLKLVKEDYHTAAKIRTRINDIKEMKKKIDF